MVGVVVVRSVDLMMKLITFRFRLVSLSPCSTSRASCTSIQLESIYRPGESYQSRMTNALCPNYKTYRGVPTLHAFRLSTMSPG